MSPIYKTLVYPFGASTSTPTVVCCLVCWGPIIGGFDTAILLKKLANPAIPQATF